MFDRRSKSAEFRTAVNKVYRGDPFPLAAALRVPPPSPSKREKSSSSKKKLESFQADNGTDWSAVLNAWLDACEASDAVRYEGKQCAFLLTTRPFLLLSCFLLLTLFRSQQQGRAVESYEKQAALHAAFNQTFASSVGNLLVPALLSVCKSTHRLAVAADQETGSRDSAKLQNAVTLLQESFSRSFNDRKEFRPNTPFDEDGSKKAAVLGIVNELFDIYFQLNTLRLCKNLVKPVEARKLHLQGSMGQMVTYRYYTGRLNLFEDDWAGAEANLEYALTHCHKNAVHNKRCILRYLVPVKLYLGKLPTPECTSVCHRCCYVERLHACFCWFY